ncbi:Aste57867_23925 [Aphanomyces stellatus]|uniref:Aste57867_23925 protein n=1 Tax=Aphanomyces stellatus TaxID=120398 RepID=A0A485LQ42_9STRA|nr:hypothetical protein As57867_023852 [Aphanomyces stellatus]VFU00568.1 Aste57867_23925 [Aphanomyces stellatus]
MSAFTSLVACEDMFLTITQYQPGTAPHMKPFMQFIFDHHINTGVNPRHEDTCPTDLLTRDYPFLLEQMAAFGRALDPWFAHHGLDGIPRLIRTDERLRIAVLFYTILHNNVTLFAFLRRQKKALYCFPHYTRIAAWMGSLPILQYIQAHGIGDWGPAIIDWAAYQGNLEVIQWLHATRNDGCTTQAMDGAARYGHQHVVEWLHHNRTEGCTTIALDQAATYGYTELVQWLHVHRTEGCTKVALDYACYRGHTAIVEFLLAHRSEGQVPAAMVSAACAGHVHLVELLYDNGGASTRRRALEVAARCKRVDVCRFLLTKCTPEEAAIDDFSTRYWMHESGLAPYAKTRTTQPLPPLAPTQPPAGLLAKLSTFFA